jgi:hypothetical protein
VADLSVEKSRSVELPTEKPEDAEESSNEESDEDVPSKIDASNATTQSASESESESEDEADEDEDAEMASNVSSGRDSRSPVTFSQHQAESEAAKQNRSASPESASASEDEAESDSSEDNDASDKESENHATTEDEASDDEEEAEIQVPESSPTLPRHKPTAKPAGPTVNHHLNSKNNTIERDTSTSTQGEIDQQLTSSIFEVRRPSPASSPPQRAPPALKVGASLMALNSKKPAFSSSAKTNNAMKALQLQTLKEASGSEDESEEESDDASSDSDEETARHISSAFSRSPNKPKPKPVDSDSDSSADSNSDSEGEVVDTATQIRNELAAQIESMRSNDSQKSAVSIPSPKVRGTQEVKPKNKYLSGYSFSQPGL